jgi:hypothetical protein
MRLLRLLLATLVLSTPVRAQEVSVTPKLRDGDAFRLEVTRLRDHTQRPQHNGRSTTVVDVRVVTATKDGVTLDWIPGDTTFENPAIAADPLFQAMARTGKGFSLRLTLNALGEMTGIANEAEVQAKLKLMLDTMVGELMARVPAEERPKFEAFMKQTLSAPVLLGLVSREAGLYFGLNGAELTVGRPVEVDLEHPAPFGGGTIPSRLRVEAGPATADAVSLTTTTTYDGAALLKLTRTFMEQAGTKVSDEELAKVPPFEMHDSGTYSLDLRSGLMREVTVDRHVNIGPNRRHDGWTIRLVQAPAR